MKRISPDLYLRVMFALIALAAAADLFVSALEGAR